MYQNYSDVAASTPTAILISTVSVEEESNVKVAKVDSSLSSHFMIALPFMNILIPMGEWAKNLQPP